MGRVALLLALALPLAVHSQPVEHDLAYACSAHKGLVQLLSPSESARDLNALKAAGADVEFMASDGLIEYVNNPGSQIPYRKGTKSVERTCGPIAVRISGGYLNQDPNREQGGVTYPIVRVSVEGRPIGGSTSIGKCDKSSHRYANAGCPTRWATSMRVMQGFRGDWTVSYTRTFEEVHVAP